MAKTGVCSICFFLWYLLPCDLLRLSLGCTLSPTGCGLTASRWVCLCGTSGRTPQSSGGRGFETSCLGHMCTLLSVNTKHEKQGSVYGFTCLLLTKFKGLDNNLLNRKSCNWNFFYKLETRDEKNVSAAQDMKYHTPINPSWENSRKSHGLDASWVV